MGISGIISGGLSLAGGLMGAHAAKSAASAESNAIQQGINFQQGVYGNAQSNLQPWIGGGQQALQSLLGFYGLGNNPQGAQAGFQQFQNTPFYQFPMQQGQLALNRQLASSGLIGSGAALKEGTQFASGLASQGLSTYLGGLGNLSTAGQGAAGTLAQAGNQAATTMGNLYGAQGAAIGGGIIGGNNALQQGLQNLSGPLGAFGNGLFGMPPTQSGTSYNGSGYLGQQVGNWLGTNSTPAGMLPNYAALGGGTGEGQ